MRFKEVVMETDARNGRRFVSFAAAVLLALTIGGWVGVSNEARVDAASCDELRIDVLALQRCVVPGGQTALDNGYTVRFDALSNSSVHWLAGHRTTHGATFNSLTNLQIGDVVEYRGSRFAIEEYQLVDRHAPTAVVSWMSSPQPRLVLQTSASSPFVHVWRAELAPVNRDQPAAAVRIAGSAALPVRTLQEPIPPAPAIVPAPVVQAPVVPAPVVQAPVSITSSGSGALSPSDAGVDEGSVNSIRPSGLTAWSRRPV